ncbi:hypothetical protein C2G38_247696 [Gigaspora rosea]|uniref:B30.2/SPRY domain-containing protein n=1 Tax=Gigaspora rosea TaxID=44941 RepID=A0A397UHG8_9GLOM|nr:hypothetical protein C2G38_247696 [Gigaspora rosea]
MGHTEGINSLGYCYQYGIGVEKDENKAFIYYQKLDNFNGMRQIGCYSHPISPQCKLFYFEVNIIDEGKNKAIGIGFWEKMVKLNKMPGWSNRSWGYHGDNGKFFCCSKSGQPYGSLFSTGDTIGCCLNFKNNTVFYTKNGINLGIAFRDLKDILYPCVGSWSQDASIELNFGHKKFKYTAINGDDIDDKSLEKNWTEALNMCDNVNDLVNSLKIEQDTAYAFKCRGKFNFIIGKYDDALIDLTKVLDTEPNSKFALRYRGETYYLMGTYKESCKDVNKLLKIEANDEWASKMFIEISKNPFADETYELGYFYFHGINVEKDEYKAFTYFEKSAKMGHTEGINSLGYCYQYGIGVEKDENKAFIYYQKLDHFNGMRQVGCYYHPIPPQCKLFYFEVDIIDEGKNKAIGIGFWEKMINLDKMPGWDNRSWGYHGDNGNFFCCSKSGHPYGSLFSTGDTIGCYLNFNNNTVFYTKNGINLGIAFQDLKDIMYPCVGSWSQDASIGLNFGHRKFKYTAITCDDIDDELLENNWTKALNMCDNASDLANLLKIEQNTAYAFKCRGKFNFIIGKYDEALIDLTKLLDIEPNSKFALRYRGETYYLMGRYKESCKDVNKLLKIEANDEWASKIFIEISKNPFADETYELGYFYLHGINIEKDEYKAFTYFEKSAKMGHTEGINSLGYCYEYGIGVEKNENKAFINYQKSADMNNPNGMYQVGYCYNLGIGVEVNKYKAFEHYLKSAEAGSSLGIRKTAICYCYGIGVEKNNDKFRKWFVNE